MKDPSSPNSVRSGNNETLTTNHLHEVAHYPGGFASIEMKQALLNPVALSMMSNLFSGLSTLRPDGGGDKPQSNSGSQASESQVDEDGAACDKGLSLQKPATVTVTDTSPTGCMSVASLSFDSTAYTAGIPMGPSMQTIQMASATNGVSCTTPQIPNPFMLNSATEEQNASIKIAQNVTAPFLLNEQISLPSGEYGSHAALDIKKRQNSYRQINQFFNGSSLDATTLTGLSSEPRARTNISAANSGSHMHFSLSTPTKSDEDFCELCQKHFCNKYYLRKHKADVHGIHTEPYSHSRKRETSGQTAIFPGYKGMHPSQHSTNNLHNIQQLTEDRLSIMMDPQALPKGTFQSAANERQEIERKFGQQACANYQNSNIMNPVSTIVSLNPLASTLNPEYTQPKHYSSSLSPAIFHVSPSNDVLPPNNSPPAVHPMLSAHYYMMALANSLPFNRGAILQNGTMEEKNPNDAENKFRQNFAGMPFMPAGSIDPGKADIYEVQCDQCQKVFCSQYFLQIHKINQHNCTVIDAPTTPMASPNDPAYSLQDTIDRQDSGSSVASNVQEKSSCSSPGFSSQPNVANQNSGCTRGSSSRALSESKQPVNSLDAFRSSMVAAKLADRVTCELCKKELCNKYFLRTHKIRVHGISPKDVGGPPMRNPPQVNSTVAQTGCTGSPISHSSGSRSPQNSKPNQANSASQKVQPSSLFDTSNNLMTSFPLNSMFRANAENAYSVVGLPVSTQPNEGGTLASDNSLYKPGFPFGLDSNCLSAKNEAKTWAKFFIESSQLAFPTNADPQETYSAITMISCPICEQPIGPRLFLPSHLSDAHGLNPVDPAFFLNILRAKTIQHPGLQTSDIESARSHTQITSARNTSEDGKKGDGMPILTQEEKMHEDNAMNKSASSGVNDFSTYSQRTISTSSTRQKLRSQSDSSKQNLQTVSCQEKGKSSSTSPNVVSVPIKSCEATEAEGEDNWNSGTFCTTDGSHQNSQGIPTLEIKPATSLPDMATCRSMSLEKHVYYTSNHALLGNGSETVNIVTPGLSALGLPAGMTTASAMATALPPFPSGSLEAMAMAAALASGQWNPLSQLSVTSGPVKSLGPFAVPPVSIMTTTSLSSINSNNNMPRKSPNQMRVLCDICNKWICNKYFLRTHKANKHGLTDSAQTPLDLGKSQGLRSHSGAKSPLNTPFKRELPPLKEMTHLVEPEVNGCNQVQRYDSESSEFSSNSMKSGATDQTGGTKDENITNKSADQFAQAWKSYGEPRTVPSFFNQPSPGFLTFPFPLPGLLPPELIAHLQAMVSLNPMMVPSCFPGSGSFMENLNQTCATNVSTTDRMDVDRGSQNDGDVEDEGMMEETYQRQSQESRDPLNLSLKYKTKETVTAPSPCGSKDEFGPKLRPLSCKSSMSLALKYLQRARATQHFRVQWLRSGVPSQRGRAMFVSSKWKRVKMFSGVSCPATQWSRPKKPRLQHLTCFPVLKPKTDKWNQNDQFPSSCSSTVPENINCSTTENREFPNIDTKLCCPICAPTLPSDFTTLNQLLQHLALVHGSQTPQKHSVTENNLTEQLQLVCTKQQQCGFQVSDLASSSSPNGISVDSNGNANSGNPAAAASHEHYNASPCVLNTPPISSATPIKQTEERLSRCVFLPVSSHAERQPAV
ncbi:hypothetical protein CRM22_004146 [Opisthorchis felineus]|uniref:C2H2-type domain-containing protein n=1 Tax=Opisthorchis felineus TaxID=147828 RepID=A0A4S2M3W2_OPIFE|nr:hypothetical protein CRM22_004146 [Opisthorchis felineus]